MGRRGLKLTEWTEVDLVGPNESEVDLIGPNNSCLIFRGEQIIHYITIIK